jgi:hypothetical protein
MLPEFTIDGRDIVICLLAGVAIVFLALIIGIVLRLKRKAKARLDKVRKWAEIHGMETLALIVSRVEQEDLIGAIVEARQFEKDLGDPDLSGVHDLRVARKCLPLWLEMPKVKPESLAAFVVWCKAHEAEAAALGITIVKVAAAVAPVL